MTQLPRPNCHIRRCAHFEGVKDFATEQNKLPEHRVICEAFPEGIPDEISYGSNRHLVPLPDQGNTIVYEKDGSYP